MLKGGIKKQPDKNATQSKNKIVLSTEGVENLTNFFTTLINIDKRINSIDKKNEKASKNK